jgi:hypothetical protein
MNPIDIFRVIPWLLIRIRASVSYIGAARRALNLRDVVPIDQNSPRKHTEKHGIFINHIDIFRVIRCDSVAIDQDQGLSQCHWA